jgi:hypothetical protein
VLRALSGGQAQWSRMAMKSTGQTEVRRSVNQRLLWRATSEGSGNKSAGILLAENESLAARQPGIIDRLRE